MTAKPGTITVPMHGDGVRYILVVTRQAVEKAKGEAVDTEQFCEWVGAHHDLLQSIGDRVRPKPTGVGARVYIKSHHFGL